MIINVLSCLVTQTLYFSQFFSTFLCRFMQNYCLRANVLNFEYQHLFIACKNWLCGYETWMKAIFSWKKSRLYCFQFSPWNTGNLILGLRNSKIFWGSTPPDPPRRRGLTAPCWYSRLLNCYWNPWASVVAWTFLYPYSRSKLNSGMGDNENWESVIVKKFNLNLILT